MHSFQYVHYKTLRTKYSFQEYLLHQFLWKDHCFPPIFCLGKFSLGCLIHHYILRSNHCFNSLLVEGSSNFSFVYRMYFFIVRFINIKCQTSNTCCRLTFISFFSAFSVLLRSRILF